MIRKMNELFNLFQNFWEGLSHLRLASANNEVYTPSVTESPYPESDNNILPRQKLEKQGNLKPLPENLGVDHLEQNYEFRYNQMTDETEYRLLGAGFNDSFKVVTQRDLNSFCMEAREAGVNCWDRDIARYIYSNKIDVYHPFRNYVSELPVWDGKDRMKDLARRVSDNPLWINSFHRWMLGLVAQWAGVNGIHANCMAPILISSEQGRRKSTFCKSLVPDRLQRYYTDSFDLTAQGRSEQKLALFGLINLDEFDKFSIGKMATLKNMMQMADLNLRMAYKKNYSQLPRIASFIGTSNRKDILTDPTGSRRFMCVEVDKMIDCSGIKHEQIYAQLIEELHKGERHWFTSEEEKDIMQNNKGFYRSLPEEEVFHCCFRVAIDDEECQLLSGAEIFKVLKKYNPAAMQGVSVNTFWKVLVASGITRMHTKKGNKYKVVPLI